MMTEKKNDAYLLAYELLCEKADVDCFFIRNVITQMGSQKQIWINWKRKASYLKPTEIDIVWFRKDGTSDWYIDLPEELNEDLKKVKIGNSDFVDDETKRFIVKFLFSLTKTGYDILSPQFSISRNAVLLEKGKSLEELLIEADLMSEDL